MAPALRIPVSVDMRQFNAAMGEMAQRTDDTADQIESRFNSINRVAGTMAAAVAGAGVAIGASLLSAVTSLAKIGDLSDDLRLPVNLIQALSVAADGARVPAEKLTSALEKFTEVSKKDSDEAKKFEKALGNIGQAFVKAFKDADSQEARLKIISNALKSTTDEVKRAQLSLEAFGTDNERVISLLGAGASAFETYRQNAARLGLEINESMVRQAQAAKSELLLLSRVLSDQFTGAVNGLIPLLIRMLPALKAIAQAAQAVGAVFSTDDTATVSQLQSELDGLIDRWTRLKQARNDLEASGGENPNFARDQLRKFLGIDPGTLEDNLKTFDADIAKIQQRIETVKKLIASRGAETSAGSNKPAFAPRPSLEDDKLDRFDRSAETIEKRTAAMLAETGAINDGTAARERAKIAAQLLTVAEQVNKEAKVNGGKATEEQIKVIDRVAEAYGRAAAAVERAHFPLQTFARDSANLEKQLNTFAANSLDGMTNALADVVTGTKTASEAFRAMANAIIADLARIAIRSAITGPIATALSGVFGGGAKLPGFASGTDSAPGGFAVVGEDGPEIVNLPRGSQVIPNAVAARQTSASAVFTYAPSIDARGADAAAVARLAQVIADDKRTFSSRVRSEVSQWRSNTPRAF